MTALLWARYRRAARRLDAGPPRRQELVEAAFDLRILCMQIESFLDDVPLGDDAERARALMNRVRLELTAVSHALKSGEMALTMVRDDLRTAVGHAFNALKAVDRARESGVASGYVATAPTTDAGTGSSSAPSGLPGSS